MSKFKRGDKVKRKINCRNLSWITEQREHVDNIFTVKEYIEDDCVVILEGEEKRWDADKFELTIEEPTKFKRGDVIKNQYKKNSAEYLVVDRVEEDKIWLMNGFYFTPNCKNYSLFMRDGKDVMQPYLEKFEIPFGGI